MSVEEEFEEVNLFDEDEPKKEDTSALDAESSQDDDLVEFVVPDKFKDKSLEDVITSYTNLESEYGRKNNEVGELRKLTDDILRQKGTAPEESSDSNEVGFDELIEDPVAAIDKALSKNPRIAALEADIQTTAQDNAHKAVLARHEDADSIVASAEFQAWVGETHGRQKVFADAANNLDSSTASEMLDLYKGTAKLRQDAATLARDGKAKEGLKNATTEKGGKKPSTSKKVFKRAQLIHLKITKPSQYEAMSEEINLAYAEGRVR